MDPQAWGLDSGLACVIFCMFFDVGVCFSLTQLPLPCPAAHEVRQAVSTSPLENTPLPYCPQPSEWSGCTFLSPGTSLSSYPLPCVPCPPHSALDSQQFCDGEHVGVDERKGRPLHLMWWEAESLGRVPVKLNVEMNADLSTGEICSLNSHLCSVFGFVGVLI